jgi:hypothetical protein
MVEHELNGGDPAAQRDVMEARRSITVERQHQPVVGDRVEQGGARARRQLDDVVEGEEQAAAWSSTSSTAAIRRPSAT